MIWTFYYPCENITWALLVVAKTIAFLSKNAVVSLVQSRGEGGHFKELRLPMRSTGIPMQTICFLIWSSHRRDKQGQFSERCSVFLFIKERENISDGKSNDVCWSKNME